jgi:cob(I)alamin adenosyltransferase
MPISTRTGDGGETGLPGGRRGRKDEPVVALLGALDEAEAAVGLARALAADEEIRGILRGLQTDLRALASTAFSSGMGGGHAAPIPALARIEEILGRVEAQAEIPPCFVLSGPSAPAAGADFARSVVRRAERDAVALMRASGGSILPAGFLPYLNRLSDLLFVLARLANRRALVEEETWAGPAG